MSDSYAGLSSAKLSEIRAILKDIKARGGPAALSPAALALAQNTDPSLGLTIDFAAEHDLGHPLVVLRLKPGTRPTWFDQLSPREREVALRIALGESNKEIAKSLRISPATIKDHVHNILVKSGLPSRAYVIAALNANTPGNA